MKTTLIETMVRNQLNTLNTGSIADDDSVAFYQSLLGNINSISPIKSFLIGLNTSNFKNETHSNITIITFEKLPKTMVRNQIVNIIEYQTDEFWEFIFLGDQDILIISFDF